MKCSRKDLLFLAIAVLSLAIGTSGVLAGERILPGKIGNYGDYYDPNTEESFSGRVMELCQVPYSSKVKRCCYAIKVERDDGKGNEIVYLGPKSRLDKEELNVKEGEYISFGDIYIRNKN